MSDDITAIMLTLKLACITSIILLIIATPLAWKLARWQHKAKHYVLAVVALPLILPPTVLGFYLLLLFSPQNAVGQIWQDFTGQQLAFSFSGLVLGSVVYSLPFAVQPLYASFVQLDGRYLDVATTLGMSKWSRFRRIVIPSCKPAFMVALGLTFAHTIGEFGVVLMIGGNIPGETQVLSIALFEHVEALEYEQAHALAFGMLVFSFMMMALLYRFNRGGGTSWTLK
ncbi:molybdate ABC transporter permease subunit [Alteromonas sp. C1M14]|uniref:molybdate ABC transporter permease subunit n=1 Tax=Alteromonas sp. C1M14 TaxID=2841567 RepID=UPI001C088457|nr:molybdate ABC transporter permease subunit [Alteromonas sp. C1M14]MBU2977137.1 molybdate ABC transporter permease subunit [Alteromonas sp. C1M14]